MRTYYSTNPVVFAEKFKYWKQVDILLLKTGAAKVTLTLTLTQYNHYL